jgi:hypothetical protein
VVSAALRRDQRSLDGVASTMRMDVNGSVSSCKPGWIVARSS